MSRLGVQLSPHVQRAPRAPAPARARRRAIAESRPHATAMLQACWEAEFRVRPGHRSGMLSLGSAPSILPPKRLAFWVSYERYVFGSGTLPPTKLFDSILALQLGATCQTLC